jgi:hypothetical protein
MMPPISAPSFRSLLRRWTSWFSGGIALLTLALVMVRKLLVLKCWRINEWRNLKVGRRFYTAAEAVNEPRSSSRFLDKDTKNVIFFLLPAGKRF